MACTIGPLGCGDASGWAQAVAAAIAFGLALRQGAAAAHRDRHRDRAAAVAAYTLVNNASQLLVHLHADIQAVDTRWKRATAENILASGQLSEVGAALSGFDTTRLSHERFVTGVCMAQVSVREFRLALERIAHPADQLLVRDLGQSVMRIQEAASIMVSPLVLMSQGARWRAFLQGVAQTWRGLPQRTRSTPE